MSRSTGARRPATGGGTTARVIAGLVLLFVAYVVGRAAGIALDTNPYVTEAIALAVSAMVAAFFVTRRRRCA